MGDEAAADLAVRLIRRLEPKRPSKLSAMSSGMPRTACSQRIEPRGGGQIEQRRGAHTGDAIAPGQAAAREIAKGERDANRGAGAGDHQILALVAARPALAIGPMVQGGAGGVQQRAVVVDAEPALRAADPRRQIAQVRAGAAAEVEQVRRLADRGREAIGERGAARRVVVGLAQRPARRRRTRSPGVAGQAGELGREQARGIAPARQAWRAARRRPADRVRRPARSSPGAARARAPPASPGGTSRPASAGTVSGIAPARGRDHRQAAGERFGEHHAVAFVVRSQHEQVGRVVDGRRPASALLAGQPHAGRRGPGGRSPRRSSARRPDRAPGCRRRSVPVQLAQLRPAPRAAPDGLCAASARPRTAAPGRARRAAGQRRRIGARADHADARVRRHRSAARSRRGRGLVTITRAARASSRRSSSASAAASARQPGLQSERMMDQRDPRPRQAIARVGKRRQREPVDHRQAARRHRRERLAAAGARRSSAMREDARRARAPRPSSRARAAPRRSAGRRCSRRSAGRAGPARRADAALIRPAARSRSSPRRGGIRAASP